MRIPFTQPPTLSDVTKLELCPCCPDGLTAGVRLYRLALQVASYNDFSINFGELTEVDSGTNVAVAGGLLTIKGSGAWNVNGVRKAPVNISTPGKFRITFTPRAATGQIMIGFDDGSFTFQTDPGKFYLHETTALYLYTYSNEQLTGAGALVVDTTYQVEFEWTAAKQLTARIKGGVWTDWTTMYSCQKTKITATTIGFQVNAYHAFASPWEFDNYYRYSGFAVDGPTLTYVADAGTGKLFSGLNFASLAAEGSWVTTNALFKYSFDDGTPAYNASWLTLAQLRALGAIAGSHRYIRLLVQANSDGVTQQYAAELNADDAVSIPGLASTADPLNDGTIIARINPGDTVRLLGGLESPVAATVDINIDVETLDTGTGLWSKVADVAALSGKNLAAGVYQSFAALNAAEVEWASTAVTERVYRWRVDVTGGLTRTLITYFEAKVGGAPITAFSIILDATVKALGSAFTVTGGITIDQDVTGATVTLKRYKKADSSLVATVVNAAAVNFTASVQKTWAQIAGAAVTLVPATAREEYMVAEISGGTPTVTTEASGQVGYIVRTTAIPTLTAARVDDTTIRLTVANATGMTVRSYYATKVSGGSTWTAGGTRSGNGTIDLAVSAGEVYWIWVLADSGVYSIVSNIVEMSTSLASGGSAIVGLGFPRLEEPPKTLKDNRDETVLELVYSLGPFKTLAAAGLDQRHMCPGDYSAYEIIGATMKKKAGTAVDFAYITARASRARV